MCHEHEGRGGHRRGEWGGERAFRGGPGGPRGFRGFRGGFPSREEWVERLEAHRDRLERDLANVRELIERLQDAPQHG